MCLDETSKQLVQETRTPLPPRPGAARAYDYEYQRNGVSNLFMLFAPLEGWRRVEVTDRRTRTDWAEVVRKLVDEDYADKERIVLVMDNLNTHHPASLYEAFEPAEARRIAERLEIHYTPKHGSWLNIAEIELGVLARQCLDRRIPSQRVLAQETGAWQEQRNRAAIEWTGASLPRTPASNSSPSTRQYNSGGLLVRSFGKHADVLTELTELTEVRACWSLVLLGSRRSEVVLYGAIGVAFDFQVHSADVPFGRDSSSRGRDYRGGIYGVVIEDVKQQPQESCRGLGPRWHPPVGKVRLLPGQAVECLCCWLQPLYRCLILLLAGF